MEAELKARVGERIKLAREAKGWTQRDLAEAIPGKIDPASVSRWERGRVYPEQNLDEIAKVLERDVSYFLTPSPEKPRTPDISLLRGSRRSDGPTSDQMARIEERLSSIEEDFRSARTLLALLNQPAPARDLPHTLEELGRLRDQIDAAIEALPQREAEAAGGDAPAADTDDQIAARAAFGASLGDAARQADGRPRASPGTRRTPRARRGPGRG